MVLKRVQLKPYTETGPTYCRALQRVWILLRVPIIAVTASQNNEDFLLKELQNEHFLCGRIFSLVILNLTGFYLPFRLPKLQEENLFHQAVKNQ